MLEPKYRVIVEEALREAGFDPAVRAGWTAPKKAPKLPTPRMEQAMSLYAETGSIGTVGKEMGIARQRVHQMLKKAGVPMDRRGRPKVSSAPPVDMQQDAKRSRKIEAIQETVRLYRTHGTAAAVADVLGMSTTGVLQRLRKAGVEVAGRGRPKKVDIAAWAPTGIMAAAE